MRRIGIVGAGQAGLHLGIGLLQHGYEVTIVTDRTAEDIRTGRVMGIVTLIEVGRNGLQHCPFRLPRSRNPTH